MSWFIFLVVLQELIEETVPLRPLRSCLLFAPASISFLAPLSLSLFLCGGFVACRLSQRSTPPSASSHLFLRGPRRNPFNPNLQRPHPRPLPRPRCPEHSPSPSQSPRTALPRGWKEPSATPAWRPAAAAWKQMTLRCRIYSAPLCPACQRSHVFSLPGPGRFFRGDFRADPGRAEGLRAAPAQLSGQIFGLTTHYLDNKPYDATVVLFHLSFTE